jgi:hypothetical protein
MAHWAVLVPADRYERERLFARDAIEVPGAGPAPDDPVLLIADGDGTLFGLGRVRGATNEGLVVAYTHRLFDAPVPADGLGLDGVGAHRVEPETFESYAGKVDPALRVDGPKQEWLVSVDLPIEAASAADAVRTFWTYVYDLGPDELPAFVAPLADELSMQAYVHGEPTNLDPEEDDD